VRTEHAAGIYVAVVDSRPELLPWMPWAREPRPDLEALQQGWVEDRYLNFAMVDKATAEVLGVAGLNLELQGAADLHYWIRSDHAGQGLTTEACRALVAWARDHLRLDRLTLWAGRDNVASRRVAEKLGFTHTGPLGWRAEGGLGDFAAESYELRFRPAPLASRAE
jgi:RimJ/RimL family protein N-acetyltransferase